MELLDQVNAEVAACERCPRLVAWREQVAQEKRAAYRDQTYWGRGVPGFGDPAARLVVVGLAPAAHGANRTGRMFTGDRSGDWLFRALHRAGFGNQAESVSIDDGLEMTDAWITSPVKCAPPQNKPTAEERANCKPFLTREFDALTNWKVVVALGGIGYTAVAQHFGLKPRPKFGHGVVVPLPEAGHPEVRHPEARHPEARHPEARHPEVRHPEARHIVCSYHVSQQNTFTGRLTEEMLDNVFTTARQLL